MENAEKIDESDCIQPTDYDNYGGRGLYLSSMKPEDHTRQEVLDNNYTYFGRLGGPMQKFVQNSFGEFGKYVWHKVVGKDIVDKVQCVYQVPTAKLGRDVKLVNEPMGGFAKPYPRKEYVVPYSKEENCVPVKEAGMTVTCPPNFKKLV